MHVAVHCSLSLEIENNSLGRWTIEINVLECLVCLSCQNTLFKGTLYVHINTWMLLCAVYLELFACSQFCGVKSLIAALRCTDHLTTFSSGTLKGCCCYTTRCLRCCIRCGWRRWYCRRWWIRRWFCWLCCSWWIGKGPIRRPCCNWWINSLTTDHRNECCDYKQCTAVCRSRRHLFYFVNSDELLSWFRCCVCSIVELSANVVSWVSMWDFNVRSIPLFISRITASFGYFCDSLDFIAKLSILSTAS